MNRYSLALGHSTHLPSRRAVAPSEESLHHSETGSADSSPVLRRSGLFLQNLSDALVPPPPSPLYGAAMGPGLPSFREVITRRPQERAFSLIELIVVLGIIMILLGLLMPSLQRARKQGQLTRFLGEMQQDAALVHLLADDSNDLYPVLLTQSVSRSSQQWHDALVEKNLLARVSESQTQIWLSFCMAFDPKRMTPDNLPDEEMPLLPAMAVYRRQTIYPSSKGMLWREDTLTGGTEEWPPVWCCLPNRPIGPVGMADGSALLGSWDQFLSTGTLSIDQVSRIGAPVISTWDGVEGRDR